jgi:RimJ/RimL family protein N-acetyltransferase
MSPAETRALLEFAMASAVVVPRADYVLAIDGPEGSLIGVCGLYADDGANRERELFFAMRSDVWGKGLATEAVGELVGYAFRELGVSLIYGVAHPENLASMRVMERVGMAVDGAVEDAFEDGGGWRAGRRYAILAPAI